jgi:hypothetical protein
MRPEVSEAFPEEDETLESICNST